MEINENGVQVERQYIGARYVPKFFQGADGSPEWVTGLQYEPLTVVTYLGNSFTSKIPVPAGIGNPAANPMYWVNTGNFNAQLDQLTSQLTVLENKQQTDVNNLQQNIDANAENITSLETHTNNELQKIIKNKKYILISDSYGMETTAKPTWTELWVQAFPGTRQSSHGGTGFATNVDTFEIQLTQIADEMSDEEKNEITDIVVCGGWNDARYVSLGLGTISDVYNAIVSFVTYANTTFKNAVVHIGFIGWQTNDCVQPQTNVKQLILTQEVYDTTNVGYVKHLQACSCVMKNCALMNETYFHPNRTGSIYLYRAILGEVTGHFMFQMSRAITSSDVQSVVTGATIDATSKWCVTGYNATLYVLINNVTVANSSTPILTFSKDILPWGHNTTVDVDMFTFPNGKKVYGVISPNRTLVSYEKIENKSVFVVARVNTLYEM